MFEVSGVIDYGKYSYNREMGGGKKNSGVEFGDIMDGSEETTERQESSHVRIERKTEFAAESAVDVVTYSHGGRIFMYNNNLGINLDIIV